MKSGYIDIGTNSIRLLIVDDTVDLVRCKKEVITTRIGAGVDGSKKLSEKGMNDTIEGLKVFKDLLKEEGVESSKVIATSAVRDATNKDEFIARVLKETKLPVDVITGKEEAELGFLGLMYQYNYKDTILAIDIGGGSTELILGNKTKIKKAVSIDIGAVRLTDRFITTDPVTKDEVDRMSEYIDGVLEEHLRLFEIDSIDYVVGIGGSITTLSAIKRKMITYKRDAIHNSVVTGDDLNRIKDSLVAKTIEERKKIKGLQAKRADIILTGEIILERIMVKIHKSEIVISEFDNLEGAYFRNS